MSKTRIAILATLADVNTLPIRYDLAQLRETVARVYPDLLGVELDRSAFEENSLEGAPVEVREVLIPLVARTDMVVIPLGSASPDELRIRRGWMLGLRSMLIRYLDLVMATVQRLAVEIDNINSSLVSHTCGALCFLEECACGQDGRRAWEATNRGILASIEQSVLRDPSARILIVVQCRRKHWLEDKLRKLPDVQVLNYWQL